MQIYRKFHHLSILVDRPTFLATTQGYTTVPAAGFLAGGLGPFEGFFGISKMCTCLVN